MNKPKSNSHWLIAFGKFKAHSHDIFFSWTFDLLLINSRYLVIGVYFSPHRRNIVCEYKLHDKPIIKYLSWTCFWHWCWKNLFLLNVKLKLLVNKILKLWNNFSQFHGHIFRSSRSQIFFKIGALQNFAILRIKVTLEHRYFSARSSQLILIYW